MGLLGDALELASRCPSLWRTARLRVKLTSDPHVQMRAVERAQSNMGLQSTSPPGDPWQCSAQPGLSHSEASVIALSREKYRVESREVDPSRPQPEGDGSFLVVRVGPTSWTRDDGGIYRTTDHDGPFGRLPDPSGWPGLLDPQSLVDGHDVEPIGPSVVAARPTLRIRTRVRQFTFGPGPGANFVIGSGDESLLDLDAATGLVLRMETFFDGSTMRMYEATDVEIDGAVDEALFTEQPPTGATIEPSMRMAEALESVARDAPFAVLAPTGRRFTGILEASQADRPVVLRVHSMPDFAAMRTPGLFATLHIIQSGEPAGVADPAEWEEIQLADGPGHVWQAPDGGEVHVLVKRHGTYVWLRGLIDREETLAAAQTLEPVTVS